MMWTPEQAFSGFLSDIDARRAQAQNEALHIQNDVEAASRAEARAQAFIEAIELAERHIDLMSILR